MTNNIDTIAEDLLLEIIVGAKTIKAEQVMQARQDKDYARALEVIKLGLIKYAQNKIEEDRKNIADAVSKHWGKEGESSKYVNELILKISTPKL